MRNFILVVIAVALAVAGAIGVYAYFINTTAPVHDTTRPLPTGALAPPAAGFEDAAAKARELIRAHVLGRNLAGASVAVAVDGTIVWSEGFGVADIDKRTPITPDTRFRIGPVSKALTSAAVGLLLERGKIDLDAPVQQYVPSFPPKQWPITTRQLMSHTAGVPHELPSGHCNDVLESVTQFKDATLKFQPGTSYEYSTNGWILVAAAAQAAAGEPIHTFMQREIFAPLQMTATVPDGENIPKAASPYFPRMSLDTRRGLQNAVPGDHSCRSTAGFYVSTPSDLVRFASAMLHGGLLKPETVRLLQTPVTKDSALGWSVESVPLNGKPARVVGHSGTVMGGTTSLLTFPEYGLAISLMSNVSFAEGTKAVAIKVAEQFARPADRRPPL